MGPCRPNCLNIERDSFVMLWANHDVPKRCNGVRLLRRCAPSRRMPTGDASQIRITALRWINCIRQSTPVLRVVSVRCCSLHHRDVFANGEFRCSSSFFTSFDRPHLDWYSLFALSTICKCDGGDSLAFLYRRRIVWGMKKIAVSRSQDYLNRLAHLFSIQIFSICCNNIFAQICCCANCALANYVVVFSFVFTVLPPKIFVQLTDYWLLWVFMQLKVASCFKVKS